jgi:hypothetical protein
VTCRFWDAKAMRAPRAMKATISFLCQRMRLKASLGSVAVPLVLSSRMGRSDVTNGVAFLHALGCVGPLTADGPGIWGSAPVAPQGRWPHPFAV